MKKKKKTIISVYSKTENKFGLFGQAAQCSQTLTMTCAYSLSWFGIANANRRELAIMFSSFKKSACDHKARILKTASIVCGLYIAKHYISDRLGEVKARLEQDRAARDRCVVVPRPRKSWYQNSVQSSPALSTDTGWRLVYCYGSSLNLRRPDTRKYGCWSYH